jgi:hypothetical protein
MGDAYLPQFITVEDQWQGDTFAGWEFTITRNGVVKDLTAAEITMTFLPNNRRSNTQVLTVGAGITLTDPTNGIFEVDEITPFNWDSGEYSFDCEIKYADGEIKTPFKSVWKIHQDKTNNS